MEIPEIAWLRRKRSAHYLDFQQGAAAEGKQFGAMIDSQPFRRL